jgi:hypothetical protein
MTVCTVRNTGASSSEQSPKVQAKSILSGIFFLPFLLRFSKAETLSIGLSFRREENLRVRTCHLEQFVTGLPDYNASGSARLEIEHSKRLIDFHDFCSLEPHLFGTAVGFGKTNSVVDQLTSLALLMTETLYQFLTLSQRAKSHGPPRILAQQPIQAISEVIERIKKLKSEIKAILDRPN